MMRFPREPAVGLAPVKKANKTVGNSPPSEALLDAIVALVNVHGQITNVKQNADQILHIRFEDGARVDIAAQFRDAPAVREFLVRAMRAVN